MTTGNEMPDAGAMEILLDGLWAQHTAGVSAGRQVEVNEAGQKWRANAMTMLRALAAQVEAQAARIRLLEAEQG